MADCGRWGRSWGVVDAIVLDDLPDRIPPHGRRMLPKRAETGRKHGRRWKLTGKQWQPKARTTCIVEQLPVVNTASIGPVHWSPWFYHLSANIPENQPNLVAWLLNTRTQFTVRLTMCFRVGIANGLTGILTKFSNKHLCSLTPFGASRTCLRYFAGY